MLYENKVALICSVDAMPSELCAEGEGAFDFRRTASRLEEMQSAEHLAERHIA